MFLRWWGVLAIASGLACTKTVTQYSCRACRADGGCTDSVANVELDEAEAQELARFMNCLEYPTEDSIEVCAGKKDRLTTCKPTTFRRDRIPSNEIYITACGACLAGPPKKCAYVVELYGIEEFGRESAVRALCGEDTDCTDRDRTDFDLACRGMTRRNLPGTE